MSAPTPKLLAAAAEWVADFEERLQLEEVDSKELATMVAAFAHDIAGKRAQFILERVGDSGECSGPNCSAPIAWTKRGTRRPMPWDLDGVPHWASCPDAPSFRHQGERGREKDLP